MESIILEFLHDDTPTWLGEMVDEFTEDPFCHGVLVGADEASVVFMSLWSAEIVGDVASNLGEMAPPSASLRQDRHVGTEPADRTWGSVMSAVLIVMSRRGIPGRCGGGARSAGLDRMRFACERRTGSNRDRRHWVIAQRSSSCPGRRWPGVERAVPVTEAFHVRQS